MAMIALAKMRRVSRLLILGFTIEHIQKQTVSRFWVDASKCAQLFAKILGLRQGEHLYSILIFLSNRTAEPLRALKDLAARVILKRLCQQFPTSNGTASQARTAP
jgi:hypothetical protein